MNLVILKLILGASGSSTTPGTLESCLFFRPALRLRLAETTVIRCRLLFLLMRTLFPHTNTRPGPAVKLEAASRGYMKVLCVTNLFLDHLVLRLQTGDQKLCERGGREFLLFRKSRIGG